MWWLNPVKVFLQININHDPGPIVQAALVPSCSRFHGAFNIDRALSISSRSALRSMSAATTASADF
jgi:hypothetical protein